MWQNSSEPVRALSAQIWFPSKPTTIRSPINTGLAIADAPGKDVRHTSRPSISCHATASPAPVTTTMRESNITPDVTTRPRVKRRHLSNPLTPSHATTPFGGEPVTSCRAGSLLPNDTMTMSCATTGSWWIRSSARGPANPKSHDRAIERRIRRCRVRRRTPDCPRWRPVP